jgi:predicted RNase H-like HicB family nuclease
MPRLSEKQKEDLRAGFNMRDEDIDFSDIPEIRAIPSDAVRGLDALRRKIRGNCLAYTVIIEKAGNNYSAYVPDLPECVATAATREEVERLIREAIELHLRRMREEGESIPEPTSIAVIVQVAA